MCPQAWHQSCERTIIYQEMVTLNKYYWVDSDMTSIIPIGSMITLDIVVGPQVWHQSYEQKIGKIIAHTYPLKIGGGGEGNYT